METAHRGPQTRARQLAVGRRRCQSVRFWNSFPIDKIRFSVNGRLTSEIATGIFSANPQGIEIPGSPARFPAGIKERIPGVAGVGGAPGGGGWSKGWPMGGAMSYRAG